MIQKFTIKNIATYNKTGVEFANLRKINFIYGSNGCGKSYILDLIVGDYVKRIDKKIKKSGN